MDLNQYKKLRQAGKNLSEKIPKIYGIEESFPTITRLMGISSGKSIILESEEEINFLIDFYLHEYLSNGRTMLERYRSDHPDLEEIEVKYLDASKVSYTSLFEVKNVNQTESTVTVIDLLSSSEDSLLVININLSKTIKPGYVIFSRLLPYDEFNTFSGMYGVFDEGSNRSLLKRYKVMKKRIKSDRDSVQKFVACFKINRVLGLTILAQ